MNRKQLLNCIALLLLMLLITGTALAEDTHADNSISVTDMFGRTVTLDAPATRIVALTAADCEILCALGAEETLVGRGTYCDYPESILEVPVVESGADTNLEQIISLAPQVVILGDMAQSLEQTLMLENAGIQVLTSNADSIEGVYTSIGNIGMLTGRNTEAKALIADMQAVFDDITAKSEGTGKTVYFEVSPLEWGLWAAGRGTFMDELATMCGLTNAFADVEGWAAISEEQVLARNPDYIVTITMYFGEGPTPVEEIKSRIGWESLKAVSQENIFNADSDEISRPGPRIKDAAVALYNFINGIEEVDAVEEIGVIAEK